MAFLCPKCSRGSIFIEVHDDFYECRGCGRQWDKEKKKMEDPFPGITGEATIEFDGAIYVIPHIVGLGKIEEAAGFRILLVNGSQKVKDFRDEKHAHQHRDRLINAIDKYYAKRR